MRVVVRERSCVRLLMRKERKSKEVVNGRVKKKERKNGSIGSIGR